MTKKVSDKQIEGIKAHAEQKNKETIEKVNKAIEKLKRSKTKSINFDSVAKEAGISRATLYNNSQLKERILSLRAVKKGVPDNNIVAIKKEKIQLLEEKVVKLLEEARRLKEDKKKLIVQLVQMEELKEENQRLKKQLEIKK